ncbi:hypothetical protein, partial [Streptomyces scabiei]|uniref:hypothetical protein n=1 Tax=Streptomyces scabiei TaxID=1930 RepID=UPI0029B65C6E
EDPPPQEDPPPHEDPLPHDDPPLRWWRRRLRRRKLTAASHTCPGQQTTAACPRPRGESAVRSEALIPASGWPL